MIEIVHDIMAAATTLAGLLIVFLGGIVARYEGLDAAQRKDIGPTYRKRGALAFLGFLSASFSAALSVFAHAFASSTLADAAAVLLICAFAAVISAAVLVYTQLYK